MYAYSLSLALLCLYGEQRYVNLFNFDKTELTVIRYNSENSPVCFSDPNNGTYVIKSSDKTIVS